MATKKILKKFIKNGEAIYIPSSDEYVDKTSAQTVGGVKTFTSEPVLPSKTSDAGNNATKPATEAQVAKKQDALTLPNSPTNGNLVVWGANKKTLADGGAVPTGLPSGGTAGQIVRKTSNGAEWSDEVGTTYSAGTNIQISDQNVISATDTTYQASDFDIKDLADTTGKRTSWDAKQDALSEVSKSDIDTGTATTPGKIAAKTIADYVAGKIAGVYNVKGSKETYNDLPATGNKKGDVWNIETAFTKDSKDYPAGTNVVYDGTDWDPLGGTIDLSGYVDKTSAQTISGVKTFSAEPVLPSKTTSATNDGTKPATEKQVYDVAQSVSTLDGSVVKTTGNQTIAGTKTFSTSPVVPSKTSDATNSGTAIATEAQVYKKLDSTDLGNATITVTNGDGSSIGSFTTNQSSAGSLVVPGDDFLDQDGYDAKPSSKTTNNVTYGIYEEVEI